jgi:hypothetical protein
VTWSGTSPPGFSDAVDGETFLRRTAYLISHGWCRGAVARDHSGSPIAPSDPAAISWSLLGALAAVSAQPDTNEKTLREALWGISGVIPDTSLDAWNDAPGRTQEDTLQMLGDAENTLSEHPQPNNGSPLGE